MYLRNSEKQPEDRTAQEVASVFKSEIQHKVLLDEFTSSNETGDKNLSKEDITK
jgi:hypothetical protein